MKSDIRIYNVEIENKYYEYDSDDPRYDVNDKIKYVNKEYVYYNIELNEFDYELQDYLDEIGKEYCNGLLDTTLDDIIIYCNVCIINKTEKEYYVSYDPFAMLMEYKDYV